MNKPLAKPIGKHNTRKRISFPYEVAILCETSLQTCRNCALKTLKQYKIPATKITVFVTAGLEKRGISVFKKGTYNKIQEVAGNFDMVLNDYYPVGTAVIQVKDSVRGFLETGSKMLKSLLGVIQTGFQECQKQGAHLWGIYPHAVGRLLRPTISKELKYISGCFFGCICLGSKFIPLQVPEAADYERSILYFQRDKAVVRLNFVAAFCEKRPLSPTEVYLLAKIHPEYACLVTNKKGCLEIRLRTPDKVKSPKAD